MIHTLNRRADTHHTHCEDAYFVTERDGWVIAVICDGCSDSVNSHFAAQFHVYSARKIVDLEWNGLMQLTNGNKHSISQMMNAFCSLVTTQILVCSDAMNLTVLETLSTMVIAFYHPRRSYLMVKFLGDGAVSVDGVMHRVDSGPDNAPNYISYLTPEEVEPDIFATIYPEKVFTNVNNFAIMSDGIDRIRHPHKSLEECIHYLLEDKFLIGSEKMLDRKMNIMTKEGMILEDDLTIIRYTNDTV